MLSDHNRQIYSFSKRCQHAASPDKFVHETINNLTNKPNSTSLLLPYLLLRTTSCMQGTTDHMYTGHTIYELRPMKNTKKTTVIVSSNYSRTPLSLLRPGLRTEKPLTLMTFDSFKFNDLHISHHALGYEEYCAALLPPRLLDGVRSNCGEPQ
jgi:hypothetical protein